MEQKPQQFVSQVPVLDLSQGSEMFTEFTAESLNFLASAENAIFKLDAIPNDQESIDTIYKVFHAIKGLANFLHLHDIHCLASESERMTATVRKNFFVFDDHVAEATAQSIESLRRLLTLLNEQINNNGELKSQYYDVSALISMMRRITNTREHAALNEESQSRSVAEQHDDTPIDYGALREKLHDADGDVVVDGTVLRKLFEELDQAKKKIEQERSKLMQRQRSLISEREFALQLGDQARTSARAKGDFLSSAAHEIRTLINAILGFSDLLMKSSLDRKQRDQLKTILSSGRLLHAIVNNILDFSKIENGKLILEAAQFNIDDVVQDVMRIVRGKLEDRSVNLVHRVGSTVPRILVGDQTRLKQILINLVDNAVKFTAQGEVALHVTLEPDKKDARDKGLVLLRFVVSDTGIGIPEDRRENIFESFTQADTSITRRYGGTGLGLAICKSYVEAMNGIIWVESELGKGSQFIFTAQFKAEDNVDANKRISTKKTKDSKSASAARVADASFEGIRILVADDSIPNQELMKAYFEILGCGGDFVATGDEAVRYAQENEYDMCLMDLQMPNMGGLEATGIICQTLKKKLPIIALTAAAADEERERCFDAGMVNYLAKPFDISELKKIIAQYAKK